MHVRASLLFALLLLLVGRIAAVLGGWVAWWLGWLDLLGGWVAGWLAGWRWLDLLDGWLDDW